MESILRRLENDQSFIPCRALSGITDIARNELVSQLIDLVEKIIFSDIVSFAANINVQGIRSEDEEMRCGVQLYIHNNYHWMTSDHHGLSELNGGYVRYEDGTLH